MTTKTEKPAKTGSKIDKTIYEAGIKNGLNIKDIKFTQDILKGKPQYKAYKDNIAKPNTDIKSIEPKASAKLSNDKIQQTLKDVLVSNNITKDSVIKQHQSILTQAIEVNQLSTAEKCNTKFMQLLGIDTFQPTKQTNIQINIEKMTTNEIDNKLKDIITL